MKKIVTVIFLAFILKSCVTTKFTSLESNDIEVFVTQQPLQKYFEIEIVETISTNPFHQKANVLEKLKCQAKQKRADAIIITGFDYVNILFIPFHRVEAVLIKYKE